MQNLNFVSNVKPKDDFLGIENPADFMLDLSPFEIILGQKEKEAPEERTSAKTLEDIYKEEDSKIVYFDDNIYYLLKDGTPVMIEGENKINNTFFGEKVSDGTKVDITKEDIEKLITQEEAEKIALNGEEKQPEPTPKTQEELDAEKTNVTE